MKLKYFNKHREKYFGITQMTCFVG